MKKSPARSFVYWSSRALGHRVKLHRSVVARRVLSTAPTDATARRIPNDGLQLHDFVSRQRPSKTSISNNSVTTNAVLFHIKTYGCQMNVNDSDIVRSLLLEHGGNVFQETADETAAHVLLTNTCAIREGAEQKVWQRLRELRARRNKAGKRRSRKVVVGVLGCMAERLQQDLFRDGLADLVVGPDAYRDLPTAVTDLLSDNEEPAAHVQLSLDETYADITPVRRDANAISAYCSIQRGCANRCSFCIVPFTRGQERSRPLDSIVQEIQKLHFEENVKEVTLLGQNVNSYHDKSEDALSARPVSDYRMSNQGFRSRIRRDDAGYFFADLLANVSDISPELRVRYTSPHPKDYPPELLSLMAERPNICNSLHMPAQSGSSSTLKRMKRGYTREAYLELIEDVHAAIPDVAISSDFIAGFCGETEEEHLETISLIEQVRYDQAFMFAYSMREKTHAHRVLQDDVPEEVKQRRLRQIIDVFHKGAHEKNSETEIGRLRLVLAEGESKRSQPGARSWHGRTDQDKRIIFPVDDEGPMCASDESLFKGYSDASIDPTASGVDLRSKPLVKLRKGDYAVVDVTEAKGHTLRGRLLWRTSIAAFDQSRLSQMNERSLERAKMVRQLLADDHDDTLAAHVR